MHEIQNVLFLLETAKFKREEECMGPRHGALSA